MQSRSKIIFVVGIILTAFLVQKYSRGDTKVLSYQTVDSDTPTVVPTDSPSPTPVATEAPTPTIFIKPTPTPSPTPGQPKYTSAQINSFIERFSGQYAVDPNVIRYLAICESGFRADAVNGQYLGLFQFSKNSWKSARNQMGEDTDPSLRANAEEAVQTAAYMLARGKKRMWPNCYP